MSTNFFSALGNWFLKSMGHGTPEAPCAAQPLMRKPHAADERRAVRFPDHHSSQIELMVDDSLVVANAINVSDRGMRLWSTEKLPLTRLRYRLLVPHAVATGELEIVYRCANLNGYEYGATVRPDATSRDPFRKYLAWLCNRSQKRHGMAA